MAVNPSIQTYIDAVSAGYEEIGTSADSLVASLAGITADVASLKDTIAKQNSNPGPISTEDQALLDASQAKVTAIAEKLKAASAAAKAIDDATAAAEVPTPPVA